MSRLGGDACHGARHAVREDRPSAEHAGPRVGGQTGTGGLRRAGQSPAMVAMHDRQRQCGAQWKADKAANKVAAGQTWPQYWSACNKRLKG